jgi:hypothetical protein
MDTIHVFLFFFLIHLVSNDVKLHTSFFLLHLSSNDIQLHTSFQTKLNPIENCTRVFFTLQKGIGNMKLKYIMFTSVLSIGRAYRHITQRFRSRTPRRP